MYCSDPSSVYSFLMSDLPEQKAPTNEAKEPEEVKEGTPPQEVEANPPAPEMPTVPEGQQAYALHVEGLQSALKSVVTMTEHMGKLLPLMGEHSQHQKQTSEALVTLGSSVDAMAAATKYVISNVTQSSQNEKEMVNTLRDLRWQLGGENKKLVNSSLKKVAIDLCTNLEAAMKQITKRLSNTQDVWSSFHTTTASAHGASKFASAIDLQPQTSANHLRATSPLKR